MKNIDKELIIKLKEEGLSYSEIKNKTGLSIGTIKSVVSRLKDGSYCKYCFKPIYNTKGKRPKKFCSDKCRLTWWKEHQELINRRAYYTLICKCCHKEFKSYGKKDRKYCSHLCYIRHRFNGGDFSDK